MNDMVSTFEINYSFNIGAASPYGTTPRDALDSVALDFDLKVLTMEIP